MPTSRLIFPAAASIGARVITMLPGMATASDYQSRVIVADVPAWEVSVQLDSTQVAEPAVATMEVEVNSKAEWTKSKERRFTDLVTLKALKKASSDELEELSSLRELRRHIKNPMNPDEVVFQFKKQQMAAKLQQEMERYIKFTECRV